MEKHISGEGSGINVLALLKQGGWRAGGESYVFLYDDDERSRDKLLEVLGDFAVDKELSINLYDASCLAECMRKSQDARQEKRTEEHVIDVHQMRQDLYQTFHRWNGGGMSISE